jgi:hypothetical protein
MCNFNIIHRDAGDLPIEYTNHFNKLIEMINHGITLNVKYFGENSNPVGIGGGDTLDAYVTTFMTLLFNAAENVAESGRPVDKAQESRFVCALAGGLMHAMRAELDNRLKEIGAI